MTGERNLPGLGLRGYFTPGTGGWGDPRSEDLRLVSAVGNMQAISRTTSLPGSGLLGDIYIVPTGDANGDDLAVWDGPAGSEVWNYYTPTGAWLFYIADEQTTVQWDGAAWSPFAGGTGGGGGMGALLHVRDEKPNGQNGGLPVASAWTARVLNTTKTNEIPGAVLAANQVTLEAGTYLVFAEAPGHQTGRHKIRWQNITDPATVMEGPNAFTAPGASENTTTPAALWAEFTIAAQKTFELQYMISDVDGGLDNGLGVAMGAAVPGSLTEVYAEVMVWQQPTAGVMRASEDLATGVHAGASVAGRNVRALNTVLFNNIVGASLNVGTGEITLPAGSYEVRCHAPAFDSDGHRLWVHDVTNAIDLIFGGNEHSGAQKQNTANVDSGFILAAETVIRLEHYCESPRATFGLGQSVNEAGQVERYAETIIQKHF